MPPEPRPLATDDVSSAAGRTAGGRASRPDPFSELLDAEAEAEADAETEADAELGSGSTVSRSVVPARPRARAESEPEAAAELRPTTPPEVRGSTRRRGDPPLRARQVQRILRYVAPWSALKVSFLFYLCLWLILLVAGVILWAGASSTGAIDNVESFIEELFGLERFAFEGPQMFRGLLFGGFALVVVGTAFNVLIAVLFNLISDLTGGLRLTVVEVERVAPIARERPRDD